MLPIYPRVQMLSLMQDTGLHNHRHLQWIVRRNARHWQTHLSNTSESVLG